MHKPPPPPPTHLLVLSNASFITEEPPSVFQARAALLQSHKHGRRTISHESHLQPAAGTPPSLSRGCDKSTY